MLNLRSIFARMNEERHSRRQSPIIDGFELSKTRRTLPMALLRARELLMDRFRPLLLENGVTEQQWRVLRVLQERDEVDATDLAQSACILAPSLTRIIKTLEAKGLITTRKDPEDGRRALISLTLEGNTFIQAIAPKSMAIYAEIAERVGNDRIESLLDDLEGLLSALAAKQ